MSANNPISAKDGLESQISSLAQEVVDARNQMIKTKNIVESLSAEIRAIAKEKDHRHWLLSMNSIGAYVLFLVILATGFYFIYRTRMDHVALEKGEIVRQMSSLRTEIESAKKKEKARKQAENKAIAFYDLIRSRQVAKALAVYQELEHQSLSKTEAAFFQEWVGRNQSRLAYEAHLGAMRAITAKDWKKAETEFKRALSFLPNPPYAAQLWFYLGVALMKLGGYPEAKDAFERAIAAKAEKLVSDQVYYHLGMVNELMGKRASAESAYSEYLKHFPNGSHARVARRQLRALQP